MLAVNVYCFGGRKTFATRTFLVSHTRVGHLGFLPENANRGRSDTLYPASSVALFPSPMPSSATLVVSRRRLQLNVGLSAARQACRQLRQHGTRVPTSALLDSLIF